MGRLLTYARGIPFLQRAFEHVRQQDSDFATIDVRRSRYVLHETRPFVLETLAPLQELEIDARYLAQEFLNLPILAQAALHSLLQALRNIVHLGSSSGSTDR